MRAWDQLVECALLGTQRRPYEPPPGLDGPLAEVVVAAGDLPGAAAAVWAYREAGRIPGGSPPAGSRPTPPAPADDRPLLAPEALRSLSAIIAEPNLRPLLPEWLHLAADDRRRLPPEWIPDLLDVTPACCRDQLEAAGGPRVGWLAGQRPEWIAGRPGGGAGLLAEAALTGAPDGDGPWPPGWDGPDDDRVAAFAAVRAADPERGRLLAGRVWADEPPATRAALVAAFAQGLSMADEPFLEDRLDDRRKEVRQAAASLLGRLPASRYARRQAARALAAVRVVGATVDVTPPAEPDGAARRDGVTAAGSPEEWIPQVVAAADLGAWPEPEALAAAAVASGAAALVAALSLAAERQGDGGWARCLRAAGAAPTAGLLGVLPEAETDRWLVGWIERVPLAAAVDVLVSVPAPWSAAVTDAVMAALAVTVSAGPAPGAEAVRAALPRFALSAGADRAGAVAAVVAATGASPAAGRFWGPAVASLNALVHFRQAMHQELTTR